MTRFEKWTLILTVIGVVLSSIFSGYALHVSLTTDARVSYKDCRIELEERNKKVLDHTNLMATLIPGCGLRPRQFCETLKDENWNMQFSLRSIRPLVNDGLVVNSLEELDRLSKKIDETLSKFDGEARRDILIDLGQQMNLANTKLKALDVVKLHCKE